MRTLERDGPIAVPTQHSSPSMAEIVTNTFKAGFTLRRYGRNGELTRRMIHRFPASKLKCQGTMQDVLADSIYRSNTLLRRLSQR